MKNKIIIALLIVLLSSTIIASNFYKNLAEEGKKLYLNGKYEEAIENFRIAEFGLMENKRVLKEMYLYYSLANFKLSNGDEVFEIIEKLKTSSGITGLKEIEQPSEIAEDLDTMFSVIDKTYKKAVKEESKKESVVSKKTGPVASEEYSGVYKNVRDSLNGNDLPAVKDGLRKLKRLGKSDIRTRYIAGLVYFRENNYKKAINELLLVNKAGPAELKNESSYYLALSNYFLKNYGQFLAFSQKVTDKETIGKLNEIRKRVLNVRKTGIRNVKEKFFNKKSFKKFASEFNGDITLASDILREVRKMVPLRGRDLYYMADAALKYPDIYDSGFISGLISLFSDREEEEFAEDIAKRSKYFKKDDFESIEILYQLALVYNDMGRKKKVKKMMLRVKRINPDYKKVKYYLTN